MRALILNDEVRKDIAGVVEHARKNPVPLAVIRETMAGDAPPAGDDPLFACMIPVGYRVVYSIEEHPGGWMRHISISVPGGKLPHPTAVAEIIREFGFTGAAEDCERWVETVEQVKAVNLVEKY